MEENNTQTKEQDWDSSKGLEFGHLDENQPQI